MLLFKITWLRFPVSSGYYYAKSVHEYMDDIIKFAFMKHSKITSLTWCDYFEYLDNYRKG